ncbi:MAG: hypothetical protein Q4G27_01410 [Flavobacteriaceae bacterium]|nr:hypothetical protein [Flavobacteriaceae bacterium]
MTQDYFPNESPEKSFGFKVIMTLVALMILSIIVVRVYSLSLYNVAPDPTLYREPLWYNISSIVLSIIALIGVWLTWQYRKVGVYLTIAALFLMVIINPEFDLLRTLAPMFTLFVYSGYGLFEIIPKWKFFK